VTPPKVHQPSVAPPPKVDYATDLFDMLSMDGPTEKEPESSSNDDNAWDGFQCKFLLLVIRMRIFL
jgi:stromal membrane-associated protein